MAVSAIRLSAFVGYQINSTFHSAGDFQRLGSSLARSLRRRAKPIALDASFGEFPAGIQLWNEVITQIHHSDMVIFDISENNPNVLVEAGIAFGMQKLVILLRAKSSTVPLPSDLNAFLFLEYEDATELYSRKLTSRIIEAIHRMLDSRHDDFFYFRQLWSLHPQTSTYLIPGQLPSDRAANPFDDFIRLRNYTDIDAVFLIGETLTRLYPGMAVSVRSAKSTADLPEDWVYSNLVFIGGPDFNPLVSQFDDRCPIEYRYGEKELVWLRNRRTGRDFIPSFEDRAGYRVATDYGFFAKVPRPDSPHAKLILIGGARTWGVYGAAMLVGCKGLLGETGAGQNVRTLVQQLGTDPSFLVTVQVRGTSDSAHPPRFTLQDVELL